jgi:hypothetical protein
MRRVTMLVAAIAGLASVTGCDQIQDLLGSGDGGAAGGAVQAEDGRTTGAPTSSDGGQPGANQQGQAPQGAQPPAAPQAGQPAPNAPPAGDGVCSRASRCCDIASNVQNFPEMYAAQREQVCRTLHENANLNDDGCRTTMGIVRQLLRMTNQQVPAECAE